MDLEELADYLKLQKQTLYNWLHQGKISGIKVGGVWRFNRRDIETWLKSKKRESKQGEGQ
jgi:excisionase family DNA binding protein